MDEKAKPKTPKEELQEILNAWATVMPVALINKFEDFAEKHFGSAKKTTDAKQPQQAQPWPGQHSAPAKEQSHKSDWPKAENPV